MPPVDKTRFVVINSRAGRRRGRRRGTSGGAEGKGEDVRRAGNWQGAKCGLYEAVFQLAVRCAAFGFLPDKERSKQADNTGLNELMTTASHVFSFPKIRF